MGICGHESNSDPACTKNCTGYVITIADCPVLWESTLQIKTALSTVKAQIMALVHGCIEVFPIMDMVMSMISAIGLPNHKDNAVC